jgi:hypothetical protein
MNPEELKIWLAENLIIDTHYDGAHNEGNSIDINLSFKGELKPFTSINISIP